MPNYKGFSTIGKYKKFTLTDRELVKRDLYNALNIKQGEVPGRPEVGSEIWQYIHEPNDEDTISAIRNEVRRIIQLDSRLELHEIVAYSQDNTITCNVSLSILPEADVEQFYVNFIRDAGIIEVV